ncbi:MAG TPA: hypothetical protein VMQ56_12720 [Terracidiphilus sp.]|nr:hypothetical protein [Terracidiphilus sp.]
MRKVVLLGIFGLIALPASAAHRFTVGQLRQFVSSQLAAGKSDSSMAGDLAGIELTERLTPSATERIRHELKPGPKTIAVLGLLSDCPAFLSPPPDEVASQPPPDPKAQQAMLNRASDFALNALRHLPDFLATRTTRSFESSGLFVSNRKVNSDNSGANSADPDRFSVQSPFFEAGTFNREITYRDGHELSGDSDLAAGQRLMPSSESLGMVSSGEFGSELATILLDVGKGQITWDHWEQTSAGLTAVFHYTVPLDAANYSVDFCCVHHFESGTNSGTTIRIPGVGNVPNRYRGTPPYHGNLYLNPSTGTVLRVTLVAELKESDPITQVATSVQYGSEEIGGKIFVLPLHGLVVSSFRNYPRNSGGIKTVLRINETSFANYHRFGSTIRILPTAPDPKPEN